MPRRPWVVFTKLQLLVLGWHMWRKQRRDKRAEKKKAKPPRNPRDTLWTRK